MENYSPSIYANIVMSCCYVNNVHISFDKLCFITYLAAVLYQSETGEKIIEGHWIFNDDHSHLVNMPIYNRWYRCLRSPQENVINFNDHEKSSMYGYDESSNLLITRCICITFNFLKEKEPRDPSISGHGFWKRGHKRNIEGDTIDRDRMDLGASK